MKNSKSTEKASVIDLSIKPQRVAQVSTQDDSAKKARVVVVTMA
jgi:hypothetical protein